LGGIVSGAWRRVVARHFHRLVSKLAFCSLISGAISPDEQVQGYPCTLEARMTSITLVELEGFDPSHSQSSKASNPRRRWRRWH